MHPGSPQKLLFSRIISRLPGNARIALCCAGKFLEGIWPVVREDFIDRQVVAILDDSPEPSPHRHRRRFIGRWSTRA